VIWAFHLLLFVAFLRSSQVFEVNSCIIIAFLEIGVLRIEARFRRVDHFNFRFFFLFFLFCAWESTF
jgi:hypothetical protein